VTYDGSREAIARSMKSDECYAEYALREECAGRVPISEESWLWMKGVDPGLKEQLDAERPDIDLSRHDARVAAAKDAGSYLEYRLRCEAAGVEPSSESGYRIERAAASFQGIL